MFGYSVTKLKGKNLKQRHAINFCVRHGEGAIDTYENIQKAFGNVLYHVPKYFGSTETL